MLTHRETERGEAGLQPQAPEAEDGGEVGSADRRDGAPTTNGGGGVTGGSRACMAASARPIMVGGSSVVFAVAEEGNGAEASKNGRLPARWSMTMEEKWWGASTGPGASPSSHGSTRGGPWPPGHVLPHRRRTWCRWPCDRVARSGRGWVRWLQQGEAEVVVCLIGMEREHSSDWGGSFNARQWRLWRLATMDRPESEGEASESV
jgi:hypothetical protein